MSVTKILLTGSAGRVAQAILPGLNERFEVIGYDVKPTLNCASSRVGNLTDLAALKDAMQGVDVVCHLAANAWDAPFVEELVPNNIIGPYNVLEAALACGVKRVVYASSCHTILGHPHESLVEANSPTCPDNIYGVTKAYGEALGQFYHFKHGIEFIAIRIGWLINPRSRYITTEIGRILWISQRDLTDIFRRAIETPGIGYAVVFATSRTNHRHVSLRSAHEVLGFVPQDGISDESGNLTR